MSGFPHQHRRKTVLINPRLQMRLALAFFLIVLAGGVAFAGIMYYSAKSALLTASYRGHYGFLTPSEIVRGILIRNVLVLAAVVILASGVVLFAYIRRIRRGMDRIVGVLRASAAGDLSTPTDAPGVREVAFFGRQVDAARAHTLSTFRGIREEVEFLRTTPIPEEEADRRWAALKERLGRIAP